MTESDALSIVQAINPKLLSIDPEQPLYSSGHLDSFDILQLITQIEMETKISLDLVDLLKINFTLRDLCKTMAENLH